MKGKFSCLLFLQFVSLICHGKAVNLTLEIKHNDVSLFMTENKRYLIEFAVNESDSISRYVEGDNLSLESVTNWAKKLEQDEGCFLSFTIKEESSAS